MKKMMIIAIGLSLGLSACISQEQRRVNRSENTILSQDVDKLLAENDGVIDTRNHPNVGCTRVRLVGTHRVTRFCYTTQEEKEAAEANETAYYGRFGPQRCLDQTAVGCQAGLELPAGEPF